jgi:hypothetical protein
MAAFVDSRLRGNDGLNKTTDVKKPLHLAMSGFLFD